MLRIADLNNDISDVVRVYTHNELVYLADVMVDAAVVRYTFLRCCSLLPMGTPLTSRLHLYHAPLRCAI